MLTKMVDSKQVRLTRKEEAEVRAEWAEADKIRKKDSYRELRLKVYPQVGDQLDSIFKIVKLLKRQEVDVGADGQEWLDQLQAVKDKYPKI
ncbi:hypothetical protein LCGC14_2558060 [marine sediment metagenome]|uniref:Uncharacterized protein n=1 Tax=marine sediment metagenome TaxID=412755 RepID=A0A0F9DE12_9ZZZZ